MQLSVAWAETLGRLADGSISTQELEASLQVLVEQLVAILFTEPFHPTRAQEVGARLVDLGFGHAQSLALTQRLLGRQLEDLVLASAPDRFRSRIRAVLAEIAAGFSDQSRRRLLRHQEELRNVLLVARKQAEQALRAERDFVSTVLDTADALILVTDAAGHILQFNRKCEAVSGYRAHEVEGEYAGFLVPEARRSELYGLRVALAPGPGPDLPIRYENSWRTKSGEQRQISWSVTALYSDEGEIANFIGTGLDVTEQREIEAELKQARRQLALAEEAERLRLAQDLHDDAVQQLLGLSYQLAEMQARAVDDSEWSASQRLEEVIPGLEVMRQEIVAVAQGLRRLIGALRPPGLRDLGLGEALEGYLNGPEWTRGDDVPAVSLDLPVRFDCDLPESTRNCLFRVAQEALWNARKHASANRVIVAGGCDEGGFWLWVQDDGVGFEVPSHLHRFAVHQRFGLLGMQERVAAEGGELQVRSGVSKGTKIEVRIPLH